MAPVPAERGCGHFHGNGLQEKHLYLLHRVVHGKSFTSAIASGAEVTLQCVGMMAFDTSNAYLYINFPASSHV